MARGRFEAGLDRCLLRRASNKTAEVRPEQKIYFYKISFEITLHNYYFKVHSRLDARRDSLSDIFRHSLQALTQFLSRNRVLSSINGRRSS